MKIFHWNHQLKHLKEELFLLIHTLNSLSNIRILIAQRFACDLLTFNIFLIFICLIYLSLQFITIIKKISSHQFLYLLHDFYIPLCMISFLNLIYIQCIFFTYSTTTFYLFNTFCDQIFINYSKSNLFYFTYFLHIFYIFFFHLYFKYPRLI